MEQHTAGLGLPGEISVSLLSVYDWEAPDGLHGGSPHFHTASREGYVVVGGEGEVHTLSADGFQVTPLRTGTLVWFTPGTVHRLVNGEHLSIVTLMQNSGLPESGDAVMTFPLEYLTDAETYRAAHALPEDPGEREAAARARRDLALRGYAELKAEVERAGPAALREYHERAAVIVADRIGQWQSLWRAGPLAQAEQTGAQLEALASGDATHLAQATVRVSERHDGEAWGMCGRLVTWPRPE
ncbi:MAG: cupin domain-containing protein [Demequina sp.]